MRSGNRSSIRASPIRHSRVPDFVRLRAPDVGATIGRVEIVVDQENVRHLPVRLKIWLQAVMPRPWVADLASFMPWRDGPFADSRSNRLRGAPSAA